MMLYKNSLSWNSKNSKSTRNVQNRIINLGYFITTYTKIDRKSIFLIKY